MEPQDPPLGAVEVCVNSVVNPGRYWACEALGPHSSSNRIALKKLEDDLRAICRRPKHEFSVKLEFKENELVAVAHPEKCSWHRGQISQILNLINRIEYKIWLVDHGHHIRVRRNMFTELPHSMTALPHQAFIINLHGIVPCSLSMDYAENRFVKQVTGGEWINASQTFIHKLHLPRTRTYFVECSADLCTQRPQELYGDILFELNSKLKSLSYELCLKEYALASHDEFLNMERLRTAADEEDLPSPLTQGSSSEGHSLPNRSSSEGHSLPHRSSSEGHSLCNHSSRNSGTKYLSDYVAGKKRECASSSVNSPNSEVSVLSSDSEGVQGRVGTAQDTSQIPALSKVNPKQRLQLLQRIKNVRSSTSDSEKSVDPLEPIMPSNCNGKAAGPPQDRTSIERRIDPSMKSYVLPAGKNMTSVKKSQNGEAVLKDANSGSLESFYTTASQKVFEGEHFSASSSVDRSMNSEISGSESESRASHALGVSSDHPRQKLKRVQAILKQQTLAVHKEEKKEPPQALEKTGHTGNCPLPVPLSSTATSLKAPTKQSSSVFFDTEYTQEIAMTRCVLRHGGLPLKPWMYLSQTTFQAFILRKMRKMGWQQPKTIQMHVWPAIMMRQNVVMVASEKHGKTMGYCVPLMDLSLCSENVKGNGPVVLILCGGFGSVKNVFEECFRLLSNGSKGNSVRVRAAYGLAVDHFQMVDLVNGCEVLVTTPRCFLRLLDVQNIITNLNRLCHLVFDQADNLLERFLPEVKSILGKVSGVMKQRNVVGGDPVQVIAASETWTQRLQEFTTHIPASPLLCISDALEAAYYGKPDVALHLVPFDHKAVKLIELLNGHSGQMKVVIACSNADEVDSVKEFLESACHQTLIAKETDSAHHLEMLLHSWNISSDGEHYILLCTDIILSDLHIRDAQWLIHYSLPENRAYFSLRFTTLTDNYNNLLEKSVKSKSPKVHILLDEILESEQLPVVAEFVRRLDPDISTQTVAKSEVLRLKKERSKVKASLCMNLKLYGLCWNQQTCRGRHALIPELDAPKCLPTSGDVKIRVLRTHSASHLSARLLEHTSEDGKTRIFPSHYLTTALKMDNHFSNMKNRMPMDRVEVGDVCTLEVSPDWYERVKVVEVTEKDRNGKPTRVDIQGLDDGRRENVMVINLYYIPADLSNLPAQSVDIFLCRLLPCDLDEVWGDVATKCVSQWVSLVQDNANNEGKAKFCMGKIALSLNGALWLDPLDVVSWLPNTQSHAVVRSIRQSLLQMQHAVDNPEHLLNLYDLCFTNKAFILPAHARKTFCKKPVPQPKPQWAFLEEQYEYVIFTYAVSLKCLFVRRQKFAKLLDKLLDDVGNHIEKHKVKTIPVLEPGYICLARCKEDKMWHRAQVLSQNENEVTVFYVDFGDREILERQDVTSIPDWAITKLPFQAIECGLVGVQKPPNGWLSESVDLLYAYAHEGDKHLLIKPCKRDAQAQHTGGRHYSVVLSDGITVFNQIALDQKFAVPCEDELPHLTNVLDELPSMEGSNEEEEDEEMEDVNENTLKEGTEVVLKRVGSNTEPIQTQGEGAEELALNNLNSEQLLDMLLRKAIEMEREIVDRPAINALVKDRAPEDETDLMEFGDHVIDVSRITAEEIFEFRKSFKPAIKVSEKPKLEGEQNLGQLQEIPQVSGTSHLLPLPEPCPHTELPAPQLPVPHVTMKRPCSALLSTARTPHVIWSQDLYHIWMKIQVTGTVNFFSCFNSRRIQLGSADASGKKYFGDWQLCGAIVPESMVVHISGFEICLKVQKAFLGLPWPRLLLTRRKYIWLHADVDQVESDSDDELTSVNKAMRKVPLKKRRTRQGKDEGFAVLDAYVDKSDSSASSDVEAAYDSF